MFQVMTEDVYSLTIKNGVYVQAIGMVSEQKQ